MAARKLLIVFAVLAGLFALQGTMAEALPREKARIEVIVDFEKHQASAAINQPGIVKFFARNSSQKPQVSSRHLVTLLISSIYHHSSL